MKNDSSWDRQQLGLIGILRVTKIANLEAPSVQVQMAVKPKSLEELGIERKPFYTTAEVARFLRISDQSVLDRIHLPADDPRRLYALALGPRTYRIPVGALAHLIGIETQVSIGTRPRRIDDAIRDEVAPVEPSRKKARSR